MLFLPRTSNVCGDMQRMNKSMKQKHERLSVYFGNSFETLLLVAPQYCGATRSNVSDCCDIGIGIVEMVCSHFIGASPPILKLFSDKTPNSPKNISWSCFKCKMHENAKCLKKQNNVNLCGSRNGGWCLPFKSCYDCGRPTLFALHDRNLWQFMR